jgi:hypothetical protein
VSQYPPGPPPQGPGGPPPGTPSEPGWGAPQPPASPPGGYPPQQPPPGYGQPGQPGYGQQPYPPATPTTKSGGGNGPKVLIGLAVLAVLGIGAFFVLGGDDDDSAGGSSPSGTVEAFFAASQDADCEKLMGLITEDSWNDGGETSREDALKECNEESSGENAFPSDTEVSDIKTTSEEASSATVTAKVTAEGETIDLSFPLVKENGGWRIQLDAIGPADETGVEIPDDGGDLPDDPSDSEDELDTETTLPEFDEGLPDIPECDFESDEYDPQACADAIMEEGS